VVPSLTCADDPFENVTIEVTSSSLGASGVDQSGTRLEVPFAWHRGEVTAVA
jgi:hypothetical protein